MDFYRQDGVYKTLLNSACNATLTCYFRDPGILYQLTPQNGVDGSISYQIVEFTRYVYGGSHNFQCPIGKIFYLAIELGSYVRVETFFPQQHIICDSYDSPSQITKIKIKKLS